MKKYRLNINRSKIYTLNIHYTNKSQIYTLVILHSKMLGIIDCVTKKLKNKINNVIINSINLGGVYNNIDEIYNKITQVVEKKLTLNTIKNKKALISDYAIEVIKRSSFKFIIPIKNVSSHDSRKYISYIIGIKCIDNSIMYFNECYDSRIEIPNYPKTQDDFYLFDDPIHFPSISYSLITCTDQDALLMVVLDYSIGVYLIDESNTNNYHQFVENGNKLQYHGGIYSIFTDD